jgi:hypothetical protein
MVSVGQAAVEDAVRADGELEVALANVVDCGSLPSSVSRHASTMARM